MSANLKNGNEYLYQASKNVDPIWLTYVGELKGGLHRFFSSEFPTLEYHIGLDRVSASSQKDFPLPPLSETYVAFKGGDKEKEQAYQSLFKKRSFKD